MNARIQTCAPWIGFLLFLTACGSGGGGPAAVVNGPPAAQIQVVDALSGAPGLIVEFFGQGADPDCDTLRYAWDLDGDGATDSTLQSPTFTYAAAGDFDVTCTVTDASGATAVATCTVSTGVAPPAGTADPVVQVRCHTLLAAAGLETFFHAAASDPDGGTITTFDWDLDGNGSFELSTAIGQASATYPGAGNYTPRVRAVSSDGSSSIASLTLHVCPADALPDQGPGVQVEPDPHVAGADEVGSTSSYMALGADLDGGAVTLSWDLDIDGDFSDKSGRTVTSDAWTAAGPTLVRLRATDDEGKTSMAQAAVTIGPAMSDTPPTAYARACTLLASTDTPVQFLGTGSDLQDGSMVTYAWDLDGDGLTDSTAQNPTFTFTVPGLYTPSLEVSDMTGNTVEAYLTLVVECCTAPSGSPPPWGPYWWCDCEDTYLYHGGNADIAITCPTLILSAGPTMAGVVACNGQPGAGGDPFCAQARVSQPPTVGPGGAPIFPPAALFPVAAPFSFNFESTGVDSPARTVQYTVQLKLVEPGIRVQQLKCQVYVIHGAVTGGGQWDDFGGGNFGFDFAVQLAQPPVGVQFPMPPVWDFEILFLEQNPVWTGVNAVAATLPAGWQFAQIPGGIHLFTTTNPMLPGEFRGFQGLVVTTNTGAPPQNLHIRLSDEQGNTIGQEILPTQQAPP